MTLLQIINIQMSNQFSTKDYAPPEWQGMPTHSFYLQVIKDGDIVNTIHIKKKSFSLIGRLEDLCDICIDNPTVSRKHAILQFKEGEDKPYLFDLAGVHGTIVNRQKLPPKVYQQVQPFDSIKFGMSSRVFILRCPELEQQEEQAHQKNEESFAKILSKQNKPLTQQQMKDKYLNLLENDPYHKANNQKHKLEGMPDMRQVDGIDWGIGDEYQIYAYNNDKQFTIEPDILRRLPGLDHNQLNKIAEYEVDIRKYEEIEGELTELANKQKRQFGLEEKKQDRKYQLQTKLVEALEAVDKSQGWIRTHLFGEQKTVAKQQKLRDVDQYENDQFMDRTLNKKKQKASQIPTGGGMKTTVDYWKLEKQFSVKVKQLHELQEKQQEQIESIQEEGEDGLDAFMRQNNQNLQNQNNELYQKHKKDLEQEIEIIRSQLREIITEKDIQMLEKKIINREEQKIDQEKEKQKKNIQGFKKIESVLNQLQALKKEEQQLDEEDPKMFELYKSEMKLLKKEEELEASNNRKREREEQHQQEIREFEKPIAKYPKQKIVRDIAEKEEEEAIDLTKLK